MRTKFFSYKTLFRPQRAIKRVALQVQTDISNTMHSWLVTVDWSQGLAGVLYYRDAFLLQGFTIVEIVELNRSLHNEFVVRHSSAHALTLFLMHYSSAHLRVEDY